jgi:serine/threonine protein kinase
MIGNGYQGIVYEKNGKAVKTSNSNNKSETYKEYWNLHQINQRLPRHSNIIQVFEYRDGYFSMEYLKDYIPLTTNNLNSLSAEEKWRIYEIVASTIYDLHYVKFTHGDIHISRNIMYHPLSKKVKVIDFGYSQCLDHTNSSDTKNAIRKDFKSLERLYKKFFNGS